MATSNNHQGYQKPTKSFQLARTSTQILSNSITLPYYRFYRQNTLLPILSIARGLENGEDHELVSERMMHWRDRKLDEFRFVQAAGTLLAAAVIGCFSWPQLDTIFWLGPAFWYSSLTMALFAVLLSSSQSFLFSTIRDSPKRPGLHQELAMIIRVSKGDLENWRDVPPRHAPQEPGAHPSRHSEKTARGQSTSLHPEKIIKPIHIRWNMVFTWQAPMMLMAYSAISFIAGLTIYVITPLYDGRGFDDSSKAAIFFITFGIVAGCVFVWCSFWAYKYIELDE